MRLFNMTEQIRPLRPFPGRRLQPTIHDNGFRRPVTYIRYRLHPISGLGDPIIICLVCHHFYLQGGALDLGSAHYPLAP